MSECLALGNSEGGTQRDNCNDSTGIISAQIGDDTSSFETARRTLVRRLHLRKRTSGFHQADRPLGSGSDLFATMNVESTSSVGVRPGTVSWAAASSLTFHPNDIDLIVVDFPPTPVSFVGMKCNPIPRHLQCASVPSRQRTDQR